MSRFIFILLALYSSFSLVAEENEKVELEKRSNNSFYESTFVCESALTINLFQSCNFKLFHKGKDVENAKLFLKGGMPVHEHGLPTSPKVKWSQDLGLYLIQGLRFSMPGQWSLHFRINASENLPEDQIDIIIDVS